MKHNATQPTYLSAAVWPGSGVLLVAVLPGRPVSVERKKPPRTSSAAV